MKNQSRSNLAYYSIWSQQSCPQRQQREKTSLKTNLYNFIKKQKEVLETTAVSFAIGGLLLGGIYFFLLQLASFGW